MSKDIVLLIGRDTGTNYGGRIYFKLYATLDLRNAGNINSIAKLPWKNEYPDQAIWEWYPPTGGGAVTVNKDVNGNRPQPVRLNLLIETLEEEVVHNPQRPLIWALALMKSMQKNSDGENLSVLICEF